MARQDTSRIKKEVMLGIKALLPGADVKGRNIIETPKHKILVLASRDYGDENGDIDNWYSIWDRYLKKDVDTLLFTTGDKQHFLMMPFEIFDNDIKPFLRPVQDDAYFFLFSRGDEGYFLPKHYVPKKLKGKIKDEGIDLNKYANNLSFVGASYKEYLKLFQSSELEPTKGPTDIHSMVKKIAEKDPSFLAKSTEEKLIILRYNQIQRS